LVGGLIDVIVGLLILPRSSMAMGSTMNSSAILAAYFLLALGVIVFVTGVFVFIFGMKHQSVTGLLMILYGVLMLILGVGMIEQVFSFMMQGSIYSGIVMIFVGLVMLYSGFNMAKTGKTRMMWNRQPPRLTHPWLPGVRSSVKLSSSCER